MPTESPNSSDWHWIQSSLSRSVESSPCSRRSVWVRFSKRFIAIWRNVVAIASSSCPVSRSSRLRGSSSAASIPLNVSASPNTDAVSAVVSGVEALKSPSGCAIEPCRACPSSCASVRIERRSPV